MNGYNDNGAQKQIATLGGLTSTAATLGENLDAQINQAKARLKELEDTKARLESTGLLTSRIDDLRRAMQY